MLICKNKLLYLLFLFSSISLNVSGQEENINLTISGSPIPWVLLVLAVIVVFILIAVLAFVIKKSIGEEFRVSDAKRKKVEDSYARKLKKEFQAKQTVLDHKIEKVRQRFSMVMMKVKHLLDTLDPEEVFKAVTELIEEEVGASRYIMFLYDPVKEELYPFRWSGYSDKIKDVLFIPASHPHLLTQCLKRNQTLYRALAIKDPEIRQLVDRKPVSNTLVAIPVCTQEKQFGVVHIEAFADGHTEIEETELRFLSALPTFIGGALNNADIFVQTRDELTSVQKISEQEIAEKRKLKDMFSRYSSAELVDTLLKNPESIDLGGENKEAAILFCDIAGFTNFSSRYSPKEVVALMNEYLSRMTEVILDYQGEIDKFIGDAIMARFGVMGDLPYPGRNAVESACGMLEELEELQKEWTAHGMETFSIRIGIASGLVLAGNIGSKRRQEFTVMGSTVNLASRLENLNKEYGTNILVDEQTFNQLPHGIKHVKRENVRIRGLDELQTVYEIKEYSGGAKIISFQNRVEKNNNTGAVREPPVKKTNQPSTPKKM
ncbi:MAG: adenylate/guanylate cyclase domain-containing protein [Candidatus Rifleibacteriota bacterium]